MSSLSGRNTNKNIPKFPSDIGTAGQYIKLKSNVNDGFEYVDETGSSGITNLDNYSQTNAISINSTSNDIQLKTQSTTRLEIANIGASNQPARINLNIGDLTEASDTTHGELRFARGNNPAIRYHSILTRHSDNESRSALDFLIHDPSISSSPANTGQRRVMTLQGDGKCGINLTTTPTEALDVNGDIKCTDLKFQYNGSTETLSTIVTNLPTTAELLPTLPSTDGQFLRSVVSGSGDKSTAFETVDLPTTAELLPTLPSTDGQFLRSVYDSSTGAKSTAFETVDLPTTAELLPTLPSTDGQFLRSVVSGSGDKSTAFETVDLPTTAELLPSPLPSTDGQFLRSVYDSSTGAKSTAFETVDLPTTAELLPTLPSTDGQFLKSVVSGSGDKSTAFETVNIISDLDNYFQTNAISINSVDNNIELKTKSTTRLEIANIGISSEPGRINLNIGDLTEASDTTHGELRFARGDNPAIRYHSILTRHSNVDSRSALDFLIHDSSISSSPANTGQLRVMTLQGDGKCGINLSTTPTEILDVNGTAKATDFKFAITGGTYLASSLYSTQVALNSAIVTLTNTVNNSGFLTSVPMATDATLGGVIIDGGNLSINSSGKLSASIVKKQSLSHVGVFNLQTATNLRTLTDTFIRWKPAITSGSSGLLHNASDNIPEGTLFTCNDGDGGVYNINVQIAITEGTDQDGSFHVLELITYKGSSSHTARGTPSRIYFIGSGYANRLDGTNICFYGGNIQITMEEDDQFEIVSSLKFANTTDAINVNGGVTDTRLTIDRLIID